MVRVGCKGGEEMLVEEAKFDVPSYYSLRVAHAMHLCMCLCMNVIHFLALKFIGLGAYKKSL